MVIMSLRIVAILSLLELCRAYTPAANPPMLTHASMDVGNIISIVIPESPDENINVEQLTGEFRQQLERIKKQSRASKVEHGLVTLKRVLPEMSREEKRKTLPLIRRVLHGRRVANSGSMKNWTREALRLEQMREGGQLVRSRSAGNHEERRIYRDYEEPGNREAVTTRADQLVADKDDYRRVSERTNANRREEAFREDPIRRSDQIRQEELIHHEDSGRYEDRIISPEEGPSSSQISRSGHLQEWNDPNWEDQSRGEARVYPETSTVDCNYKSDRAVRQKEPGNEILPNDRYDKIVKIPEIRVNIPEETNVDCTKQDQQMTSRYPFPRKDGADNAKGSPKEARAFELGDIPGFVNYPREYDIDGNSKPDCDSIKMNSSEQSLKDRDANRDVSFDNQHQEAMNFEREGHRASQRIIQDSLEQFKRLNASGFENIVSESVDNYSIKKKTGHSYFEDFRDLSSIKPSPGKRMDRWNTPTYDERHSTNSSDDIKGPANMYKVFGEKDVNPGLAYIQSEQGGFRANLDNEHKTAASQEFANSRYGSDGRVLRIQRAINGTYPKNETSELPSNVTQRSRMDHGHGMNESIFERLKHLFKSPPLPNVIYNSVILLYANESEGHDKSNREAFTEAAISQSRVSPSMVESNPSTNHEVPEVMRSTTDLSQIRTTEDLVIKPHTIVKF